MKSFYRILEPFSPAYGKIGLDLSPNSPMVVRETTLLLMGGERANVNRLFLQPYVVTYYPALQKEKENYITEKKLIRLYQQGVFGYARQVEFCTDEMDKRCDQLLSHIYEIELDERDYVQHKWLCDAGAFLEERQEESSKQEFFSGAIIKSNKSLGEQLPLIC